MKTNEPIPGWTLERYLLGELPEGERRRIEERLRRDPALESELEALRRSNLDILRRYPAGEMVEAIRRRAAPAAAAGSGRRAPRRMWLALPALAMAAAALFLLPPLLRREVAGRGDYIGIKGERLTAPALRVFRKTREGSETLPPGSLTRPGDLLQLAYMPGEATDGIIFSIDGRSNVTLHFPTDDHASTSLEHKRSVLLKDAYQLDDAPDFERFFLITANQRLPVSEILAKARRLAADPARARTGWLQLPAGFRQTTLLVAKGDRP